MGTRYDYVKGLADSAQERATKLHREYEEEENPEKKQFLLNDFFYWIGHANAYRGVALQIDFMETVEMDEDEEARCP